MEERFVIVAKILDSLFERIGVLVELGHETITQLSEIMVLKVLKKGETYQQIPYIGNSIGFVKQGMLRQYYYKKGKVVTYSLVAENEVFYCMDNLERTFRSPMILEALESVAFYAFPHNRLEYLASKNKEIGFFYRQILECMLVYSQNRTDLFILESAHERYERFKEEHPSVIMRAPLQYVASYLQMSPESLSRVRAGVL